MTSLGATNESQTQEEMLHGLRFPKNTSKIDIASFYGSDISDNNLKIGKKSSAMKAGLKSA